MAPDHTSSLAVTPEIKAERLCLFYNHAVGFSGDIRVELCLVCRLYCRLVMQSLRVLPLALLALFPPHVVGACRRRYR